MGAHRKYHQGLIVLVILLPTCEHRCVEGEMVDFPVDEFHHPEKGCVPWIQYRAQEMFVDRCNRMMAEVLEQTVPETQQVGQVPAYQDIGWDQAESQLLER